MDKKEHPLKETLKVVKAGSPEVDFTSSVSFDDFYAYMPAHKYSVGFVASREQALKIADRGGIGQGRDLFKRRHQHTDRKIWSAGLFEPQTLRTTPPACRRFSTNPGTTSPPNTSEPSRSIRQ